MEETEYSASLSVVDDYSGDLYITIVEPATPGAELEVVDLQCPRAVDPLDL